MNGEKVFVRINKGTGIKNWYLTLVADNGETLATSEGYFSKWNAKRAAKKNFPGLEVVDLHDPKSYKKFR